MTRRQLLAFGWTMTALSLLSRALCGGRPVSTRIFQRSTAFISPVHSSSFGSYRPGRVITPSIHDVSRRRLRSSLAASSLPFHQGDNVQVSVKGESVQGVIQEVRGSGWYAVKVNNNDGADTIIKVRGKQLSLATTLTLQETNTTESPPINTTTTKTATAAVVPPPTIIDIDAALASATTDPVEDRRDLEYLRQCAHHASVQKWVVFTDLHCAPSTLDTCLQVLQKVHAEALERNAGVLFLGDFWHHRATIRVDILNAVLAELRSWQVPSILFPGNHDQVTLGGHNHGLTPLEHSYRVESNETEGAVSSVAGPLVFSHPTKFMNALYVPHIRDVTVMESVLSSNHSIEANCLFVHADVTGAYMNDLIVSQGGVSPSCFPANTPIYSGHFHKPHVVKRGDVCIEYIGSPYETSLAEAQQQKALLVLDASDDWKRVERIPLHIGRKHFRVTTIEELLALHIDARSNATYSSSQNDDAVVKVGDRVVVTLPKEDLEQERRQAAPGNASTVDAQIKTLRQAGVVVEVREVPSQALGPLVQPQEVVEEMTPQRTLSAFLTEEVRRESFKNNTAEELLKAGLALLEELELSEEANGALDPSGDMTDLTLESVSLQGFGSFKDAVTYPLEERGLVLVRGTNKDGGGDSNGSGKSSLAMATLWALTGTLDARPMQDAKVSDVVNDASKSARVTVRGTLNDKPFVITRTKTSTKGALVFHLDGEDLTTQSIKETQALIDENLGVGSQIVARTMFHGQFAMNGLLEATDARFKEELSLVVPLSLWQQGATTARAKSREASKKSSEFEGMIRLRSSDVDDLVKRRDETESSLTAQQNAFEQMEARVMEEIKEIRRAAAVGDVDVETAQTNLESASTKIQELESLLNDVAMERDSNLDQIEAQSNDAENQRTMAQSGLQSKLLAYDQAVLKLENIDGHRKHLESKWSVDIVADTKVDLAPPQVCPTCQQPISSTGEGHSHEEMQRIAREEIDDVLKCLADAQAAVKKASDDKFHATGSSTVATTVMTKVWDELAETKAMWAEKASKIETDLYNARMEQALLSSQIANAAKAMQQEAIIRSKEATLLEEKKVVQASQAVYQNLCKSVDDAETRLQELRASGEAQRSLSVTMTNLVNIFGPRGVQTYILQNAIDSLQSISQVYLDELSDGSQRLELKLDAGDRISRRALIRGADGEFVERPLSSLSGGQWRRCSLALSLGFSNLVSSRGRFQSSLVVLDEPLTDFDRSGRSRVGSLLRSLLQGGDSGTPLSLHGMAVSTILVILQDLAAEELEEAFDHIDEVVKQNGMSTVSLDEQT